MKCTVIGCDQDAVTVLWFLGQVGHVHVCAAHEAADREWCDVVSSASITTDTCPARVCSPEPVHVSTPRELA